MQESTQNALPVWNLSHLYQSPEDPKIQSELAEVEARAKAFAEAYQGKLAGLSGAGLGEAIVEFEAMSEILGRIGSYAQLLYAEDVSNAESGRFLQTIQERITDISTVILFFTLEINRLEDAVLDKQFEDAAAAKYRPWVRDIRAFRDYQLSDELEQLLHEKSVAGRSAWVRLFEETMADLRFTIDGEELTLSDVLNRLSDPRQRQAQDGGQGAGPGPSKEYSPVCSDHQYAGQGQTDRRPVAPISAPRFRT